MSDTPRTDAAQRLAGTKWTGEMAVAVARQLERECAGLREQLRAIADFQADAENLRDALVLIFPMAKGYALAHQVGNNWQYCLDAEKAIAASFDRANLAMNEVTEQTMHDLLVAPHL